MTFAIDRMPIPDSLDGPGGADFIEMVRVRNAIELELTGNPEAVPTAADILPRWQDPYSPQTLFVARVDGAIVGRSILALDIEEGGAHVANVVVEVLAAFQRRGIGSALFAAVEALAAENRRTTLQTDFLNPPQDGPRIESPTGYGSVPAHSPGVPFARARGFALEQVVRASRLALPYEAPLAAALAASGAEYAVETWEGATPEHRVDDLATLHARMSTDAPAAGLDVSEEKWDAERIRTLDALRAKSDTSMLTAAAVHLPTGRLVAYSELSVPDSAALAVRQEDTLVLREHRGHRLGMLVKVANLELLGRLHPGHPSVTTFNAEENRPMLDVNEAIGFVPYGYEGAWKRVEAAR